MNPIFDQLVARIRGEVADLDRSVQRAVRGWQQMRRARADQDVYLDSVALNLHGFYSGLERLFELIARHVDTELPSGEAWHRDLLQRMSHDLGDVRPAVISESVALEMDEFRRFRHLVRNVYTTNLVPARMERLVTVLPSLWPTVRDELLAFADFLERIAAE